MKARSHFFLLSLILGSFLFACARPYYAITDPYRISELPTPAQNREVSIIWDKNNLDEDDYVITHLFDTYCYPDEPYANLLKRMLAEAGKAGVDALILLGNSLNISGYSGLPLYDSDNTDFLPSIQAEIMTDWMIKPLFGLGIKYKSNIDYLHRYRYLDQLWAFDAETDSLRLQANLFIDFSGQVYHIESFNEQRGDFFYQNYIRQYSLDFLLKDKSPEWSFRDNADGSLRRRVYRDGSGRRIRVKPFTDSTSDTEALKVTYSTAAQAWKTIIRIKYNERNQVEEKEVFTDGRPHLKITHVYDEEGRLMTTRFISPDTDPGRPLLVVHSYYYDNEDVWRLF